MLSYGMMANQKSLIERVKTEFGGAVGLATKLSATNPQRPITSQAISQWKQVPAGRVLEIETLTGISRHDLRPDVFGPAKASAAA
jgi:DNA-binding transcriptional regulator YdaS (Cro superfamily)